MSIYSNDFQAVALQKFGSGFTFTEWYLPNTDSVNYTVNFNGQTGTIYITGLTLLQNSGESIRSVIRTQLDEVFP